MTTNNNVNSGLPCNVVSGGTGVASIPAYSIICGGITSTDVIQTISGTGITGQVITSTGSGSVPVWANSYECLNVTSNPISPPSIISAVKFTRYIFNTNGAGTWFFLLPDSPNTGDWFQFISNGDQFVIKTTSTTINYQNLASTPGTGGLQAPAGGAIVTLISNHTNVYTVYSSNTMLGIV